MNDTQDPEQQIENVKFLRRELEGRNRPCVDPLKIDHRSPEQPKQGPGFSKELSDYYQELDHKLSRMVADRAAGRTVSVFPPVRAGLRETLPGTSANSNDPGPNLGKLMQHQMKNVLYPMQKQVASDRTALTNFLEHCG